MREKIFSIIIPVYNAEETIERTLASLISNRDYIYEIIIVNDRCTDGTLDKIDQFRPFFDDIVVLDNTGEKGPGPARKVGILAARAKYITFLDSDDCLTPSSLYYVYKKIKDNLNCAVVFTKTIFYESGSFVPEHVAYCDNSCGGSFYRRQYIRKNRLYPHDNLYMAEDEYFNKKIELYMKYCEEDETEYSVHLDYPVYEVHHDTDFRSSLASHNWSEYACKYHPLYICYIVEDMFQYKNLHPYLKEELIKNFIFLYFVSNALLIGKVKDFNLSEYLQYFKLMLKLLEEKFDISNEALIRIFKDPKYQWVLDQQLGSAIGSANITITKKDCIPFEKFIDIINKDQM